MRGPRTESEKKEKLKAFIRNRLFTVRPSVHRPGPAREDEEEECCAVHSELTAGCGGRLLYMKDQVQGMERGGKKNLD